jgi:hypothetical protein
MALFMSLGCLGLAAYGLDLWFGPEGSDGRRFAISIASTFVFQGLILVLIQQFLRQNQLPWSAAFGLRHPRWGRALVLAVGAAILVVPVNMSLMWLSQRLMEWQSLEPVAQRAVEVVQTSTRVDQKVLLGCLAMVTAPVVEELLFRGILYPAIKQAGYPRLALWSTALVFAATHAHLPTFLPLTFFALVLTFLYEYTENLLAPIVAHSLFNSINYLWALLASQVS